MARFPHAAPALEFIAARGVPLAQAYFEAAFEEAERRRRRGFGTRSSGGVWFRPPKPNRIPTVPFTPGEGGEIPPDGPMPRPAPPPPTPGVPPGNESPHPPAEEIVVEHVQLPPMPPGGKGVPPGFGAVPGGAGAVARPIDGVMGVAMHVRQRVYENPAESDAMTEGVIASMWTEDFGVWDASGGSGASATDVAGAGGLGAVLRKSDWPRYSTVTASVVIDNVVTAGRVLFRGRFDADGKYSGYAIGVTPGFRARIERWVDDVLDSILATQASGFVAAGDRVGVTASGRLIRATVNGLNRAQAFDDTFAEGFVGLASSAASPDDAVFSEFEVSHRT